MVPHCRIVLSFMLHLSTSIYSSHHPSKEWFPPPQNQTLHAEKQGSLFPIIPLRKFIVVHGWSCGCHCEHPDGNCDFRTVQTKQHFRQQKSILMCVEVFSLISSSSCTDAKGCQNKNADNLILLSFYLSFRTRLLPINQI